MKIYIKNMVCNRCILAVKAELGKLNLHPVGITLGEIEFNEPPSSDKLIKLGGRLKDLGFELLDDQKQKQIEKIKTLLIQQVQSDGIKEHLSLSAFLTRSLNKDYSYISRLFSEVEGITIEQYFIFQRIEKAKELLVYGEMNTSEIAYQLGYSSVAHLSAQFKKITGLTPSDFKKMGGERKALDKI